MKSRTRPTARRIIMFFLLSIVEESVAIEEVSSSSLQISQLNSLPNNLKYEEPSEKRAYVSQYKRLPLYNFGIGKRWIDNSEDKMWPFSFGIGKRMRDYKFGLGKRNNEYHPLSLDYLSADDLGSYHSREDSSDDFMEDKRDNHPFSFGIGKRPWKLATTDSSVSGRSPNDFVGPKYLFSLGKGMTEDEELVQ